jgi:hypothetical protein
MTRSLAVGCISFIILAISVAACPRPVPVDFALLSRFDNHGHALLLLLIYEIAS